MPHEGGFYFMWENFFGIGKFNGECKKFEDDLVKVRCTFQSDKISPAFDYTSSLIFGYAFSPVNGFYLSLGSGISAGIFTGWTTYPFIGIFGKNIRRRNYVFSWFVGMPFDVSIRYYFSAHTGILFGLEDVLMFPRIVNDEEVFYYNWGNELGHNAYAIASFAFDSKVGNHFTLMLGLTTRR